MAVWLEGRLGLLPIQWGEAHRPSPPAGPVGLPGMVHQQKSRDHMVGPELLLPKQQSGQFHESGRARRLLLHHFQGGRPQSLEQELQDVDALLLVMGFISIFLKS